MEPVEMVAIGFLIAREILQVLNLKKEISEEELAKLIATNLTKINLVIATIKKEMGVT